MDFRALKSLVAAFGILIVGGLLAYFDCYHIHSESNFLVGIGCSLIASAGVTILNALYVEYREKKAIDEWKIDKIYPTRAEKNKDSDPKLDKVVDRVDGVAFGLSRFRKDHEQQVRRCLECGVNFRFITMNPNSSFAEQRSIEEGDEPTHMKHSIEGLIEWAKRLNAGGYKGRISIKGYSCMTLDFYWRMDDEIYIGPYWYDYQSSQTITYKFVKGGKGYETYKEYFDRLWNNDELMTDLV